MIEQSVDIVTPDGVMNSFLVYPDEGGPFPVVLFYMDAPGKREELHDMARRIASVGYLVLLPNLYYRRTREFQMVRDEAGFARMYEQMNALSNSLVADDTTAMLKFIDGLPQADGSRVGAVGYCMSGPFVIAAAARHPRLRCIASVYGARMVTDRDDSPHKLLQQVRCETYVAVAEIDQWAPKDHMAVLQQALQQAGMPQRMEWYAGAKHGFAFPLREGIYDKPSAERHWTRLFALFERNLKQR